MDKETIIKGCENWVNNHKGENFLLTYSSVVELLAVLKEQEDQIKNRNESLKKAREEIKWLREMLKEQEAVELHQAEAVIWHAGTEHIYLIDTCGACNERIEEDAVFCSRCGRRILWQGR